MNITDGLNIALNFGLLDSIFSRRSRRFGLGMEIKEGTLKHKSRFEPIPLTELEEAFLIWAGTGRTGLSLGDLPRTGISWLFQWTGRSWPCSCNSHSTELFYTNDKGVYMVKLFDLMPEQGETAIFSGKSEEEKLDKILRLFRRSLIKLQDGRSCGLDKWIEKGYIRNDVRMSLFDLELRVLTTLNVEQAFICQNMNLALQALGLGGWAFTGLLPHYALGVDPAYKGLGFRFIKPEKSLRSMLSPVPVGRDGVFEALCPPYVKDMSEAVDKFLKMRGDFWKEGNPYPYQDPQGVLQDEYHPSEVRIQIVKDFCIYVYENYGRFPAFLDPMFARLVI